MKRTFTLIIAIYCLLFITQLSIAQIIHVPDDQPTIQAGIDAAFDGDTVLVADNIYFENVNYNGKAIMLASHFIIDGDTNHINNTIINGSQAANPDFGSAVTLNHDEDTTSILCGFTITGGTGLLVAAFDMRLGGGIATNSAGVKIINNKIINNEINHPGYAAGGGIGCLSEDEENWLVARNNLISGNTCQASVIEALGAGVFTGTNLIFEKNEVFDNACAGINNAQANGAGILLGSQSRTLIYTLRNNFIHDNNCNGYNVVGAGVMLYFCEGTISGNEIWNNIGIAVTTAQGGGIHLYSATGITNVFGNNFLANILEGYQVQGGGIQITLANDKINIYDNSFIQNELTGSNQASGGGIEIIENHEVLISNNLFNGNVLHSTGITAGAGISGSNVLSKLEIRNNMISSNSGTGTEGFGGGINLFNSNLVRLEIDGNIFKNNSMITGGGLFTYNCYNSLISNNVFSGNSASEKGGGCMLKHYAFKSDESSIFKAGTYAIEEEMNTKATMAAFHPLLINNTFLFNESSLGGAIYCDHQDEFPLIVNSIFWGNDAITGNNIYYTGQDSLLVSFCNINDSVNSHIHGKWKGTNNIYGDPGLIDDSCHIDPSSPCFDAGTDSLEFVGMWYHAPDHDYEGSPRPFYSKIDIGADEFDGVEVEHFNISSLGLSLQSYPNPLLNKTTIEFLIPEPSFVTISVYDISGKQLETILSEKLPGGKHKIKWNATGLKAGIYFIQVSTGQKMETQKLIKLRY